MVSTKWTTGDQRQSLLPGHVGDRPRGRVHDVLPVQSGPRLRPRRRRLPRRQRHEGLQLPRRRPLEQEGRLSIGSWQGRLCRGVGVALTIFANLYKAIRK